jgi:hypothetical protein
MAVTRRSLWTGGTLAIGAGMVGAGLDRIAANLRRAQDEAEARARLANALRRQAQTDAEQSAAAVRAAILGAEADKAMALDQVKAQLPSGGDSSVSVGFERLGRKRPWLGALRHSVGYFECITNGVAYRGAAEILDWQGTLVLCGHEFVHGPGDDTTLQVSFRPNAANAETFPIKMRYLDRDRDLAFATLAAPAAASAIRDHGLNPIRWGHDPTPGPTAHGDLIFVGYPEGIGRLHATQGVVSGPRAVNTVNGDGSIVTHACKIETRGVTFSGMSGGGVFQNGDFVGMVNFSSPAGSSPFTYFTPASAIEAAYIGLFPDRARAAGLKSPSTAALGARCGPAGDGFQPVAAR